MATIDNRLLNCDTDQDVTENFNRIIKLIDEKNYLPDNLIILTDDNSTIVAGEDETYVITNAKLYNALKNMPEGGPNFKVMFVGIIDFNSLGLSYGELTGDNPNSITLYFDSDEACAESYTFTASEEENKTTAVHTGTIRYVEDEE